jgi:hypothetical protein
MFDSYQRRGVNWIFVIVYLIFGVYFLNHPFQLIKIPSFIIGVNDWIIFIGGIFMLIGAVNSIRIGRGYAG